MTRVALDYLVLSASVQRVVVLSMAAMSGFYNTYDKGYLIKKRGVRMALSLSAVYYIRGWKHIVQLFFLVLGWEYRTGSSSPEKY